MTDQDRVDTLLAEQGYVYIGGVQNRTYLHAGREEILHVAVNPIPTECKEQLEAFRRAQEAYQLYAGKDLMPEILEVGEEYAGLSYPYLLERYVSGTSLSAAFAESPRFWVSRLPREIKRIYDIVRSTAPVDVSNAWRAALEHLVRPAGYDSLYDEIRGAGEYLRQHHNRGYLIHGNLRFDSILALDEPGRPGRIMLMRWENSRMMTLAYEFASLYAFIVDPTPEIEMDLRMQYEGLSDLRDLWLALSPILRLDLEIDDDEFWATVLFRMGSAWLHELAHAMRQRDEIAIAVWEERLRRLLSKEYMESFPYTVTGG